MQPISMESLPRKHIGLFSEVLTTDPQSKQDRIPYKQSRPRQSCRQALSPTVI